MFTVLLRGCSVLLSSQGGGRVVRKWVPGGLSAGEGGRGLRQAHRLDFLGQFSGHQGFHGSLEMVAGESGLPVG